MSKPLELRPLAFIAASYVAGPLAGLLAMWLLWLVPAEPWAKALGTLPAIVVVGGAICLAIELMLVTPLLIGFRRRHWPWLNGLSAIALGFAAGYLIALGLGAVPLLGVSLWGPNNVAYVVDGARTPAGWEWLAVNASAPGLVGAITALVFRLLAVRRRQAVDTEQISVF